jgi:molybdopterin/thiamine biosynthesis adenylyltransferase
VTDERYSRNATFLSQDDQDRVAQMCVGIVGLGGLGSHVAQQLAYLGVKRFDLIDPDVVTVSSLNRLVGSKPADAAHSMQKVQVARRTILSIQEDASVEICAKVIRSAQARDLVSGCDVVFGCVDRSLARVQLTDACSRFAVPLFDLASDTQADESFEFGGRVVLCDGNRCVVCLELLDQEEMNLDLMTPGQRAEHDRIYGIDRSNLLTFGPMVVSVNGVVASLAVTEFLAFVTGFRSVFPILSYRGDLGRISRSIDQPQPDCYYCHGLWGSKRNETN